MCKEKKYYFFSLHSRGCSSKSHQQLFSCCLHSILIVPPVSSAFHTVDHNVLINSAENYDGFTDVGLSRFISHMSNWSFCVLLGHVSSSPAPLFRGVSQGSLLDPLLFTISTLPLGLSCVDIKSI